MKAWRVDYALAAAMVPVQLVGLHLVSLPVYALDTGGGPTVRLEYTPADWGTYALVLLTCLALAALTRWPRAVLVAVAALFAAYMLRGYSVGPVVLPVMICLFTAALTQGARRTVWASLAIVVASASWWVPRMERMYGDGELQALAGTVTAFYAVVFAMFAGAVFAGEAFRTRRELAEARVAEAHREGERRLAEERLRISRDLHDVVAHSMAGIAVQAGAVLRMLDEPSPDVRASLTAIRSASKEALHDLRSTVGDLRERGGLDRLDALLVAVRSAGVPVELSSHGEPVALPPEIGHTAYRIVQESLTNVLRHAGHGASARVRLTYAEHELELEITDDGPGSSDGPGNGLSGMRERAEAAGGSLQAGSDPSGGFRVAARLPLAVAA